MCAICGIVNKNGGRVDGQLLQKMRDIMDYRGADETGIYVRDNVGLGHRRLKIIDLQAGQQPMANEDNTVFLVCDGEIYNFKELRAELEGKGHAFRSRAGTEVILHMYEEKGIDCLESLRGMFAFAVWDDREKRLFMARDRIGEAAVYLRP